MIKLTEQPIRIFQLASHARAGETMLLKLLDAHPQIHVVSHVQKEEAECDIDFTNEIRQTGAQFISRQHWYVNLRNLHTSNVFLVKQGTWYTEYPFKGIVLVRNPFSFVQSMIEYNRLEGLNGRIYSVSRKRYSKTFRRLLRWTMDMSGDIHQKISKQNDVISALCIFYNHRVSELISYSKTIYRYEDVILNTKNELKNICKSIDIEFQENMIDAHLNYKKYPEGHGKNRLDRGVDEVSMEKWKTLNKKDVSLIHELTSSVAENLGYRLKGNSLSISG